MEDGSRKLKEKVILTLGLMNISAGIKIYRKV